MYIFVKVLNKKFVFILRNGANGRYSIAKMLSNSTHYIYFENEDKIIDEQNI